MDQKLRKTENKQKLKEFTELKAAKPDFISLTIANSDNKISNTAKRILEQNLVADRAIINKFNTNSRGRTKIEYGKKSHKVRLGCSKKYFD